MDTQKGNTTASVIVTSVVTIAIFALVIYGLMHAFKSTSVLETNTPVEIPQTLPDTNTPKAMDTHTTTTNTNAKPTEARVAKNGDTLVMNYTGRLTDGTVFDSNVDAKFGHVTPFTFVLGAHQVITGWDEGLLGMKVGEKKTLTIPPEKGYGARGAGSSIPPNATLIFDVELVAIK
jgi:FKBP-type peptidyl-prolyl cis-trans isomerase